MKYSFPSFFIILAVVILIPNALAQEPINIPSWIKNNAEWWASDQIPDSAFLQGIQYLINEGIMAIPSTDTSGSPQPQEVPTWIKNTAGWWSDGQISDDDFVNAIQYLVKISVIIIPQTDNVSIDDPIIKSSANILDTTSFFEVVIDHMDRFRDNSSLCLDDNNVPCPGQEEKPELYTLNSEGFRGSEFTKDKPDNTYRIITVGGSTTFGLGVTDEKTWPHILDEKLQNINVVTNIEVINAGVSPFTSNNYRNHDISSIYKSKLITEKLIHYKPDLIIVFGGNNDTACNMPIHITKDHIEDKELKMEVCGVYSPDNYDTIYAERWSEVCRVGENNGFDTVFILQPVVHFDKILTDQEFGVYFDSPEYTSYLNSLESYAQQLDSIENHCTKTADFRGVFDYYLEPLYFNHVHVGDRGNEILAGKVLELISPILHEKGIIESIPAQSSIIKPIKDPEIVLQLYEANWGNLSANQKSFVGQDLSGKDFSNSNLENKIFFGSDLTNANFENSVLSGSDFSLANLEGANFKNAAIDGIKLRQTILDQTDFTNVDFRQVELENVDLTNAILKNTKLQQKDLTKTFLYKSDLTGADLTQANLSVVYLGDTILKDANLTSALLYEADLSLALDKDLSGVVLIHSIITHSDLVGIDLSGKNLSFSNFHGSDLTGQDFSDNTILFGNNFQETELSNSNFEGVDMFNDQVYSTTYKNAKADLAGLEHEEWINKICAHLGWSYSCYVLSTEFAGDDLNVDYVIYMDFKKANLENANFKNTDLRFANFYFADLTNADLSGADLRMAFLDNADLSNANLDGAILDGAILTCKNHELCE